MNGGRSPPEWTLLWGVQLPSTHGYCPSQIYISSVYVLTTSSLYRATEYRICLPSTTYLHTIGCAFCLLPSFVRAAMENCIYCIEILHPIGMLDRDQRTTKIRQQTDTNYCDTIRIPRFHIVHHQHHQHDHHLLNRHLWTRDDSTRLHCGSRRIQSCHHHQKTLSSK